MTKKEFEIIAGIEVDEKVYNEKIEPMYNQSGLDKHEFVKLLDLDVLRQKMVVADTPWGHVEADKDFLLRLNFLLMNGTFPKRVMDKWKLNEVVDNVENALFGRS